MTPELLARSLLPTSGRPRDDELAVLVPAALTRLVLRRMIARELRVRYQSIERRPLFGKGPTARMLLYWIRPAHGDADSLLPHAFVRSLGELPGIVVGRPVGSRALLVDVRCRLPTVPGPDLMPRDEIWLLGAADVGHARLVDPGELQRAETLLAPSDALRHDLAFVPGDSMLPLPEPDPVRLIRRRDAGHRCEAILLDERELGYLRRLLHTRPLDKHTFLLPGPGQILLTAPSGLLQAVPLGIPLWRCGPGGLFLELGTDLFPPLPASARKRVLGLSGDHVVTVTSRGAIRFELEHLRPAWVLWAGKGPAGREGLSAASVELLRRLEGAAFHPAAAPPSESVRKLGMPDDPRPDLLRRAQHAELLGDLRGAAELLEQAGELHAAGRLWERAAREAS